VPARLRSSSAVGEAEADAEHDEAYRAAYATWAPAAAQDKRLLFVLADAEDAEDFEDDSKEFWAVQVHGQRQSADSFGEGTKDGGELQRAGGEWMWARWAELDQELSNGDRTYLAADGDMFKLPLDSCLFVCAEEHIKYNRDGSFRLLASGVSLVDFEVELQKTGGD